MQSFDGHVITRRNKSSEAVWSISCNTEARLAHPTGARLRLKPVWEWSTNRGKCLGQLIWRYFVQSTAGDAVSPLFDVAQHRVASTDSFKTHKSETLFCLLLVRHQRSWHLLWYGKTSVWNEIQVCVEVSGFTTGPSIFFFLFFFSSFSLFLSPARTHSSCNPFLIFLFIFFNKVV